MTCYKISMDFHGDRGQLTSVTVTNPDGTVLRSVRGKTPGAEMPTIGTFQWTSAVRALCTIVVRARLAPFEGTSPRPLQGQGGSLASSLDYAISKGPNWLAEMFGTLPNGDCAARRLFRITNSNRKRPGPVVVGINMHALSSENINIVWDERKCDGCAPLRSLLAHLERIDSEISAALAQAA